LKFLRC